MKEILIFYKKIAKNIYKQFKKSLDNKRYIT